MEALGINLGYIIMQILLFIILLLVLRGYAYAPVLRILEERKARIAKGLEDARQAAIARENADAEARKILDAARAEAAKIRADAAVQAEETARAIEAEANQRARSAVTAAQEDAAAERNRILSELRSQVGAIAMAAASKLVRENLSDEKQRRLLADFFAKVPDSVRQLSGDKAEVTSALRLNEQEKESIRSRLNIRDITFREDPAILGGLIIRAGDEVVDVSVANELSGMREALAG